MSITTVATIFITTIVAMNHPYFGKGMRGTRAIRLSYEFLPIDVCLTYFHKITFPEENSPTAGVTGASHENQLTKRNNVFEREKALKRNVAQRPVHAMLGRFWSTYLNMKLPRMKPKAIKGL